jgi:hypothetical protein
VARGGRPDLKRVYPDERRRGFRWPVIWRHCQPLSERYLTKEEPDEKHTNEPVTYPTTEPPVEQPGATETD